jgi:hypothetical protein
VRREGCGGGVRGGECGVWSVEGGWECGGQGASQVLRPAPGRLLQRKGWRARACAGLALEALARLRESTTRVLRSSIPADAVAWPWTGTLLVRPERSAVRPYGCCDAAGRVLVPAVRVAVPVSGH